ncbi:hypothetical protein [Caldilinea sp.]|uniref:hypothetical protein n=1 Tax=Caldilinea sp. TaxID=2293560 RepID=UPI0021DC6584|nr:hypothetical protein [Caldilinea sp.]GIV67417.1 MAG: hypothetical protein KatS3mg048_0279 [Caldilinea sp.]
MSISPVLDQPQSIDYLDLAGGPINRLANHELICWLDADCNPQEVYWPWANRRYVRSIVMRVLDWQEGELVPLVTRFFPGHQETIAGSEGVIVTKRLCIPYQTNDDRSLFWLLECQAEGDRLLRLEIDIDWGEPLTQRIVDGLLVAQRNPGPAQGLYRQSNAESTRVFGNPHGRPDAVDLDDPAHARLIYHVLVNGIVEVPFVFTVSDVGEQLAWSSFLTLREVEEIFDVSTRNWTRRLHMGRLWTPDPAFNQAVEQARLEAVRHLQRHRTGMAPSDRCTVHVPPLVDVWDALDPVQSRNLLAHLRRVAEATEGRLPAVLPAFPGEPANASPEALLDANGAYLRALAAHHRRHRLTAQLLQEHKPAVQLCTDALILLRAQRPDLIGSAAQMATLAQILADAVELAAQAGDDVNAARWESELHYLLQRTGSEAPRTTRFDLEQWRSAAGWRRCSDRPDHFADPWRGMQLAAAAIWEGAGLADRGDAIVVEPGWLQRWPWWALLGFTLTEDRRLSLLWDGAVLHATRPVQSSLPVQVHRQIRLLHVDEFDFDPVFEMIGGEAERSAQTVRFKPGFQQEA